MARVPLMLCWLVVASPMRPSIKPHPSPFRMANEAAIVVEGRAAAEGVVTVTKVWFAPAGESVAATIRVPTLAAASRVPFAFGQPREAIAPDAVLLFLVRGDDGAWLPLLHLDGDNARGIVWFEKDSVFEYSQVVNPGPYELVAMAREQGKQRVAATPDDVRKQVASGLAARAKWAATLAIADADERARALAGWIGAQSPDGAFWYERVWGDLSPALRTAGERVVPHLANVVATHDEADAVAVACRALAELGMGARAAVPNLIARLRDLRGAIAVDLVRTFAAIGDARANEVLLAQLDAPDGWFVKEVAIALRRCQAAGFVDRIVRRLPATADAAESVRWLADMLDAVHEVDAELAERIARERFLGCAPLLTEHAWLRRLTR